MEIKRPLCKNCIHSFLFTFIVKVFTVLLHLCRIQNSIWKAKGLYQIATFCLAFNLILQYLKIFCDYYKFIILSIARLVQKNFPFFLINTSTVFLLSLSHFHQNFHTNESSALLVSRLECCITIQIVNCKTNLHNTFYGTCRIPVFVNFEVPIGFNRYKEHLRLPIVQSHYFTQ